MISNKINRKASFTAFLIALTQSTFAAQYIEGADKRTVEVTVSSTQQNVLAIEGRRITSVIPSSAADLVYQKDQGQGVLYFALADSFKTGTVSVFVNDDQNVRYKLILVPRSVGSEEIILKPGKNETAQGADSSRKEQSYIFQIKELVYHMASDASNPSPENDEDGITRTVVNSQVTLWKEANLVLLRRYDSGNMLGETYQITNTSNSTLNLAEQEFYRKSVAGVAIENLVLAPGDLTLVYVVREKK